MKVFYQIIDENTVSIFIRMESEDGALCGEDMQTLHKGETFCGVPFERFIENKTGEMEINGVDE